MSSPTDTTPPDFGTFTVYRGDTNTLIVTVPTTSLAGRKCWCTGKTAKTDSYANGVIKKTAAGDGPSGPRFLRCRCSPVESQASISRCTVCSTCFCSSPGGS